MRRALVGAMQSLGLLPYAYKARMLAWTLAPATLTSNFKFWLRGNTETLPIPGYWARLLVAGSADIPGFLALGRLGFNSVRDALERNGKPVESLRNVLDFGCGCGRILRFWNSVAAVRVFGTDMNPFLAAECQRTLPFATVGRNTLAAHLDFEDQTFDAVYALSVFTHMDLAGQRAWRDELRRVLRPGGILLVSVHGNAYKDRLNNVEAADFDAGRPVVRLTQYPGGNLCVCFHPHAYMMEKLADGFEILEFIPEGAKGNPVQDLYVLRKTDRFVAGSGSQLDHPAAQKDT